MSAERKDSHTDDVAGHESPDSSECGDCPVKDAIRLAVLEILPDGPAKMVDQIVNAENRRGPSKANSAAFRAGYDRIDWGSKGSQESN